jgi:hypothetical protein
MWRFIIRWTWFWSWWWRLMSSFCWSVVIIIITTTWIRWRTVSTICIWITAARYMIMRIALMRTMWRNVVTVMWFIVMLAIWRRWRTVISTRKILILIIIEVINMLFL